MEHMSRQSGLSYGLINVLLFVVLGSLSTFVFMAASIVLDVMGILIILTVCLPME